MKTLIGTTLAAVLLAASHGRAAAQEPARDGWVTERLQSARLGVERSYLVAVPREYAEGAARYPVLVILDANDRGQVDAAAANAAFLASRGAMPPLIVVGVLNGVGTRTRDLTPPAANGSGGGSATFAAFLADELLPHVRARYRTHPLTVLAGHSFGGLFALDVAATRPGLFRGIVAISPSLWWSDSTYVATYADSLARGRAPVRLFATSGELEVAIDRSTRRFAQRMDSLRVPGVEFEYRGYPGLTHPLTPLPSLVDGLRFVFAPVAMERMPLSRLGPGADSAATLARARETEDVYAQGARSLGLPEVLPEAHLAELGSYLLRQPGRVGTALEVLRRNAALHPESPGAHSAVGSAHLARGDTAAAITALQRAADVSRRTGKPLPPGAEERLAALRRTRP
jgi:predicted alpha/beta superfamily hydrolase